MVVSASITPAPDYKGYAAHYSPGLMERVSYNRDMKVVDCMIASPYYKIGTWVTVHSLKNDRMKVCRITDVPHPRDRARIIQRKIIAELDFNSAKYLCNISYVNQEPPRKCPVTLKIYRGKQNQTVIKHYTGVKSKSVALKKPAMVGSLYYPD